MHLTRAQVAALVLRYGFKGSLARDSFTMHPDGSCDALPSCNDDGPEDSLYFEASIVIHCSLPKGHADKKHLGYDGNDRPVTWTKRGSWVEL